jgi:hypothetical protein
MGTRSVTVKETQKDGSVIEKEAHRRTWEAEPVGPEPQELEQQTQVVEIEDRTELNYD